MDPTWLGALVALPLFSAVALAIAPFFAPPVRWTRRLKNDLEIWKSLPEGSVKDNYEAAILTLARRLHAYRHEMPGYEKFFPWAMAVIGVLALFSALIFGIRFESPHEVPLFIGGVLVCIGGTVSALSGRSSQFWVRPEEYAEVSSTTSKGDRRAEQRRRAKRRLSRMRREERRRANVVGAE